MTRAGLALVALAAAACGDSQRDDTPRFTSAEDAFSVHELPGWTAGREIGTTTFRSPDGRTVIAVRRGAETPDRTPVDLLAGTEKVLRGFYRAQVDGPFEVEGASMRAWRFELTFVPNERTIPVRRRHVVMLAPSGRAFHVMATTSRAGLGTFETAAFESILKSLREEA